MKSDHVHLKYINPVHMKIDAEPGIIMELADAFQWKAPNYQFHPKYRARVWDGNITLVNRYTGIMLSGLAKRVKKFCDSRNYGFSFDPDFSYDDVSDKDIEDFIETLDIPEKFQSRDYQIESIAKCVSSKRRTLISPTSSGKSYMIYVITQWFKSKKALIIVPRTSLVEQMASDFVSYGFKGKIHKSTDGLSKSSDIDADIVITTWHSIDNGKYKVPNNWYPQFDLVFGDEAHTCKATILKSILEKLVNCHYRFGTTGTLDGDPLNEATIEGLFGPAFRAISTAEMIEQEYAPKLKIKVIILKHSEENRMLAKNMTYADEIKFLTKLRTRNNFVKNLAKNLSGNKLIFFKLVEQGKLLYELMDDGKHPIYLIDGSVDVNKREQIRHLMEKEDNVDLLASLGTTSTGVSINKIKYMIAQAPSKSRTTVLQALGRLLRLHPEIQEVYLFDIGDDLSYKKKENFTLRHLRERLKIYASENFDVEISTVEIK